MAVELLATTGDAFVRVGGATRLQGSGAQCLALVGDTVYVGCRGAGLKRSAQTRDRAPSLEVTGGVHRGSRDSTVSTAIADKLSSWGA
jgi:hypothetical protein